MYKALLLSLLTWTGVCHADGAQLVGNWDCKMTSDYVNADQELTINDDKTYQLVAKLFGSSLVDIGNWSHDGDTLLLHREVHIKRGERSDAVHTFTYSISELADKRLVFTNGTAVSTCSK